MPIFFFQTRKTFVLFSLQWRTLFFSWTWKSITLYSMHVVQRKSRKKKEDKEIFLKKKKVVFLFVNNTTTTTAIWWKKIRQLLWQQQRQKRPKDNTTRFFWMVLVRYKTEKKEAQWRWKKKAFKNEERNLKKLSPLFTPTIANCITTTILWMW